ncbi:MAG: hypothetical protein LUQ54_03350 [Methanoregula sp.]|nr:hypothetical protein [Methanoregula sp.]
MPIVQHAGSGSISLSSVVIVITIIVESTAFLSTMTVKTSMTGRKMAGQEQKIRKIKNLSFTLPDAVGYI